MSDTPKPPAAVRLARVALPHLPWEQLTQQPSGRVDAIAFDDAAEDGEVHFRLDDLNDIALAERRVCEAGSAVALRDRMQSRQSEMNNSWEIAWMPAMQRACALIDLLDVNPELETRLTNG